MINKVFGVKGIREQGGAFTKTPFSNSGYIVNDAADSSKYTSTLTSGVINNKTVGKLSFFYYKRDLTDNWITIFNSTIDGGYLTDVIVKNEVAFLNAGNGNGTEPMIVRVNNESPFSQDYFLYENQQIRLKGKITRIDVRSETDYNYASPLVFGIKNE